SIENGHCQRIRWPGGGTCLSRRKHQIEGDERPKPRGIGINEVLLGEVHRNRAVTVTTGTVRSDWIDGPCVGLDAESVVPPAGNSPSGIVCSHLPVVDEIADENRVSIFRWHAIWSARHVGEEKVSGIVHPPRGVNVDVKRSRVSAAR